MEYGVGVPGYGLEEPVVSVGPGFEVGGGYVYDFPSYGGEWSFPTVAQPRPMVAGPSNNGVFFGSLDTEGKIDLGDDEWIEKYGGRPVPFERVPFDAQRAKREYLHDRNRLYRLQEKIKEIDDLVNKAEQHIDTMNEIRKSRKLSRQEEEEYDAMLDEANFWQERYDETRSLIGALNKKTSDFEDRLESYSKNEMKMQYAYIKVQDLLGLKNDKFRQFMRDYPEAYTNLRDNVLENLDQYPGWEMFWRLHYNVEMGLMEKCHDSPIPY
jgi:hypothetical protein